MLRGARNVGNGAGSAGESRFKCNAKTREFRANQRGGIHFLKGGLGILVQLMAQTRKVFTRVLNQRANVCMRNHASSLASRAFVSRA